ncbi:hypothetical protein D3C72_2340850 [compost metagenome]
MRGLEHFTRLALNGAAELSLLIVTPAWMNGSGGWAMEHLEVIHESEDRLYRCYTVRGGRRYYQPNSFECREYGFVKELYSSG